MNKKFGKRFIAIGAVILLVSGSGFLISREKIAHTDKISSSREIKENVKKVKITVHDEKVVSSKSTLKNIKDLDGFLFIGDSFTVLDKGEIESNNNKTYIRAKSGVQPEYWTNKVKDMPDNDKVKGISLLIGVNGAYDPKGNLNDTKKLIENIRDKYPDKTIFVQKVFPVAKTFKSANPTEFNKKIEVYNSGLEKYCNSKENIIFIDTTYGFVTDDGYLKNHTKDGLHIAEPYQDNYYKNVKTEILNKCLRES